METYFNTIAILVGGAVLSFMAQRYWSRRAETKDMEGRLREMEKRLALVDQAIVPISTAFQAILIKELTHFHTPEMDKLMLKIGPPNLLTTSEEERLKVLLNERMEDMGPQISDSERDAAKILPAVMKRARIETETLESAEALKIKLVTVAAVVGISNVEKEEGGGGR